MVTNVPSLSPERWILGGPSRGNRRPDLVDPFGAVSGGKFGVAEIRPITQLNRLKGLIKKDVDLYNARSAANPPNVCRPDCPGRATGLPNAVIPAHRVIVLGDGLTLTYGHQPGVNGAIWYEWEDESRERLEDMNLRELIDLLSSLPEIEDTYDLRAIDSPAHPYQQAANSAFGRNWWLIPAAAGAASVAAAGGGGRSLRL